MNVLIVGYRDWAKKLAQDVQDRCAEDDGHSIRFRETFPEFAAHGEDLIFFVGWSGMIKEDAYTKTPCFVLHPSPLPRYRGGSPIQHQIISGETVSAVTIFRLYANYPAVDSGPIAWQMGYSLDGPLSSVLDRIAMVGAIGVSTIIREWPDVVCVPQRDGAYPALKRRTPEQSEIDSKDFTSYPARDTHNKVRALQDPYPLPFVTCGDGRRLYILETRLETEEEYGKRFLGVDPSEVQNL